MTRRHLKGVMARKDSKIDTFKAKRARDIRDSRAGRATGRDVIAMAKEARRRSVELSRESLHHPGHARQKPSRPHQELIRVGRTAGDIRGCEKSRVMIVAISVSVGWRRRVRSQEFEGNVAKCRLQAIPTFSCHYLSFDIIFALLFEVVIKLGDQ